MSLFDEKNIDTENIDTEDAFKGIKPISISEGEFGMLRTLIYDKFGIDLANKKKGFVASRLQKLLRTEGFTSFRKYYQSIIEDSTGNALKQLASYISTNYTFFYKERAHFDFFYRTALPAVEKIIKENKSNDIRIWSAGCSTGEEPYMLAMLMMEYFGAAYDNLTAGVFATDISDKALKVAMTGVYDEEQVGMIPANLKNKYLTRAGKEHWSISPRVKKEVMFRHFNLMNKMFPFKKQFHIIFCRNVMIYFDKPTRDLLVERFYQFTEPGGYLFIGHSESLTRGECPYEYIMPAVYKRTE